MPRVGLCPLRGGVWAAFRCPEGAWRFRSPADLAFSLLSCPHPPDPLPLRGRGDLGLFYARGFAPCIPGGCTHGSPRKRQEAVPYEQRRQPRRGGTGGEELRRLRWSSPPGQGEPVPQGGKPPCPPPGTGTPPIPAPQGAKPLTGKHSGGFCKCRAGSAPGDARGEAPCIK